MRRGKVPLSAWISLAIIIAAAIFVGLYLR